MMQNSDSNLWPAQEAGQRLLSTPSYVEQLLCCLVNANLLVTKVVVGRNKTHVLTQELRYLEVAAAYT